MCMVHNKRKHGHRELSAAALQPLPVLPRSVHLSTHAPRAEQAQVLTTLATPPPPTGPHLPHAAARHDAVQRAQHVRRVDAVVVRVVPVVVLHRHQVPGGHAACSQVRGRVCACEYVCACARVRVYVCVCVCTCVSVCAQWHSPANLASCGDGCAGGGPPGQLDVADVVARHEAGPAEERKRERGQWPPLRHAVQLKGVELPVVHLRGQGRVCGGGGDVRVLGSRGGLGGRAAADSVAYLITTLPGPYLPCTTLGQTLWSIASRRSCTRARTHMHAHTHTCTRTLASTDSTGSGGGRSSCCTPS